MGHVVGASMCRNGTFSHLWYGACNCHYSFHFTFAIVNTHLFSEQSDGALIFPGVTHGVATQPAATCPPSPAYLSMCGGHNCRSHPSACDQVQANMTEQAAHLVDGLESQCHADSGVIGGMGPWQGKGEGGCQRRLARGSKEWTVAHGGRTKRGECAGVPCSHFVGHEMENRADIGWAASIQGGQKQHPGDAALATRNRPEKGVQWHGMGHVVEARTCRKGVLIYIQGTSTIWPMRFTVSECLSTTEQHVCISGRQWQAQRWAEVGRGGASKFLHGCLVAQVDLSV